MLYLSKDVQDWRKYSCIECGTDTALAIATFSVILHDYCKRTSLADKQKFAEEWKANQFICGRCIDQIPTIFPPLKPTGRLPIVNSTYFGGAVVSRKMG